MLTLSLMAFRMRCMFKKSSCFVIICRSAPQTIQYGLNVRPIFNHPNTQSLCNRFDDVSVQFFPQLTLVQRHCWQTLQQFHKYCRIIDKMHMIGLEKSAMSSVEWQQQQRQNSTSKSIHCDLLNALFRFKLFHSISNWQ